MHLLSTKQVKTEQLKTLFSEADLMRRDPWSIGIDPVALARGRVLAIIKDEGSTRTRVSFEVAMKRMGGEVIILDLDKRSSISKGETVEDTVRTVSEYVDVIVMRHSKKGMVQLCATVSKVPIINAGDGDNEHPTQALLDMYTIHREVGREHDLNVMFVGDLKCSRTAHSLIHLLNLYPNNKLFLCSPEGMRLPEEYQNTSQVAGCDLSEMLVYFGKKMDILYMTRLQKERYEDAVESPYYVLGDNDMRALSDKCAVLHPLPRNEEIPTRFDIDSRAAYFRQVQNGMWIRMALLNGLFSRGDFFTSALSKV